MSLPVLDSRQQPLAEFLLRYGLTPEIPAAIDSSMLKDFVDCPSQFYLRHILGLRKKFRSQNEASKFDWGICWHGAQEVFWKSGEAVVALRWINENFPKSIRPDTDKHHRSKERMLKIFLEYVSEFKDEINDEFDTVSCEQFFDVYDEGLGLRWCGRMDKLRRRKRSGVYVIWDYKTTSAMGENFFEGHEYGFQLPGYFWGASRVLTEPVQEIVLDVVYTLKASHKFFRRTFRYTPQKMAEWVSNVKLILEQMHYLMDNHLYEPERWHKNWNHCTRWGKCTFTDVHFMLPGESRLRVLEEDYVVERWDPLAHSEDLLV